jgi:hypothetical protein
MLRRSLPAALVAAALVIVPATPAAALVIVPVTPAAAETWHQVSVSRFSFTTALERSQGAATDGSSYVYSWRFGLSRTTFGGSVIVRNSAAIPPALAVLGSDHIGDIDIWGGRIYAPIEDSASYQRPTIALYDATTLAYTGLAYPLPASTQSHVPWVAVDPARGLVYTSDWDPVPRINLFRLGDLQPAGSLPLSTTIGRIQGGKMFQGALYLSSDNASQSIYRVDLDTGSVTTVLERNLPNGTEAEGLVFQPTGDGAVMHVLDVSPIFVVVNFRHYRMG